MPRFYFHVCDQDGKSGDLEGSELPTLDAAIEEAKASARDLAKQYIDDNRTINGRRIEICNGKGELLATMKVDDVIEQPN